MKRWGKAIGAEFSGGRRSRRMTILAGIVASIWALAPTASMAEGEADTGGFGAFALKATHGYRIVGLGTSQRGFKHGSLLLFVYRKNEAVLYATAAKVTATRIDAQLGRLGRVSLEFEPRGGSTTVATGCNEGEKATFQPGVWVGTVEFRGEQGYTRAEAETVRSRFDPLSGEGCSPVVEEENVGAGLPGARLFARAISKRRTVTLTAIQNNPGARVRLGAEITERGGKVLVERVVEGAFPADRFAFDHGLRFARLSPPAPFAGKGFFRRNAEPANRWTGGLSVDFPGHSNVSLTGSTFKTSLVHAQRVRTHLVPERPTRPKGGELRGMSPYSPLWGNKATRLP